MIPSAPTGGWPARLAIARRDLVEFVRDRRALFITLVMPMAMYPLLALSSTLGIRTAILELDRRQEAERLVLAFSGEDAEAFGIRIGSLASRSVPTAPPVACISASVKAVSSRAMSSSARASGTDHTIA